MSASRITVEGEAIEVAGRFTSEAEIDAFCERLWGIFFALNPDAIEENAAPPTAPVDMPQPPKNHSVDVAEMIARSSRPYVTQRAAAASPRVMAGLDPAIHESALERSGVDARDERGHDEPLATALNNFKVRAK